MSAATCAAKSPKTCRCPYRLYVWERKFEDQMYAAKTPVERAAVKAQLDEMWRIEDERKAARQMFYGKEIQHLNFSRRNADTEEFYTHGECFIFALAAAEETGLPLVLWNAEDSDAAHGQWKGHVALQHEDGFIDATGFFQEEELQARYTSPMTRQTLQGQEIIKHVVYWESYYEDPWLAPGERAKELTRRYAKQVLKSIPGLTRTKQTAQ